MGQRREKQVAVRFTPDGFRAIKETAAEERRTIADCVRVLVSDAIAARRAQQQSEAAA